MCLCAFHHTLSTHSAHNDPLWFKDHVLSIYYTDQALEALDMLANGTARFEIEDMERMIRELEYYLTDHHDASESNEI